MATGPCNGPIGGLLLLHVHSCIHTLGTRAPPHRRAYIWVYIVFAVRGCVRWAGCSSAGSACAAPPCPLGWHRGPVGWAIGHRPSSALGRCSPGLPAGPLGVTRCL